MVDVAEPKTRFTEKLGYVSPTPPPVPPTQPETIPQPTGYELYRNTRFLPEKSIQFEKLDGDIFSEKYAFLTGMRFLRAKGMIILRFSTGSIEIRGSNLGQLFTDIDEGRVKRIWEMDERGLEGRQDGVMVFEVKDSQ